MKKSTLDSSAHLYGQYFTPPLVAHFMLRLAKIDENSRILEPSCGDGVFLKLLQEQGQLHITAYEIDGKLGQDFPQVKHESFVSAHIENHFDLIIGNPPYIRWKHLPQNLKNELLQHPLWLSYCNNLCDYLYIFILKSVELLEENGQLIFICPEYWMNTTHALPLRNYLVANGYFECIYHFNETPIFENATVSVMIFKYVKSEKKSKHSIAIAKYYGKDALTSKILEAMAGHHPTKSQKISKFNISQFKRNERWVLAEAEALGALEAFEKACIGKGQMASSSNQYTTIGNVCHIGNGMVSGLDKAFQLPNQPLNETETLHSLKVVKAKNLKPFVYQATTQYLFANGISEEKELKKLLPRFYQHLLPYRQALMARYQYQKQIPYWHWVFLRNFQLFNRQQDRILVPCKERISNKNFFRFALAESGIFPTQDVTALFLKEATKESLYYVLAFLNNYRVFQWLCHKGIMKGSIVEFSEKPLASIPFREIDWQDAQEVAIHDKISHCTQEYIHSQKEETLHRIHQLFDKLLANGSSVKLPQEFKAEK